MNLYTPYARQTNELEIIDTARIRLGVSPTQANLARLVGASETTVYNDLRLLRESGYLKHGATRRQLMLTPKGDAYLRRTVPFEREPAPARSALRRWWDGVRTWWGSF